MQRSPNENPGEKTTPTSTPIDSNDPNNTSRSKRSLRSAHNPCSLRSKRNPRSLRSKRSLPLLEEK